MKLKEMSWKTFVFEQDEKKLQETIHECETMPTINEVDDDL